MPILSHKARFLTSAWIALAIGLVSLPGYAEIKAPWVGETLEGDTCVGKSIGFGPYDYRKRARFPDELEVVERAHFTAEVEQLQKGNSSSAIGDIAYTIMAWPNHHRALHSAMKFRMQNRKWPDDANVPPAECQMQRAMGFNPNDPIPFMMYGLLLHKWEQYEKALFVYRVANQLQPNDMLTLYNMGLTMVELEQWDEAVKTAKTVYGAGMPLPGLKNKLIAAEKWQTTANAAPTEKAPATVQLQATEESTDISEETAEKKPEAKAKPDASKPSAEGGD